MQKSFSFFDRKQIWQNFENQTFDLAIIGGGITGAGIARDAASRGMKVALVEAQDFAQGTSSRSSKLIHGGIRYLENLEFGLVFEALSERSLLFELAPHLVHPLRFVLPLYKGSRVGMFQMGLGMWLYDALSMFEAPELHERLTPEQSIQRLPLLQSHNLMGSYVYSDAYMDDDRLVIETLRSANELGANCMNYVKVLKSDMQDSKIVSIQVEDQLTHKKTQIKAKHFISSVGPWTDILAPQLTQKWKNILRPSKGVHLTFKRERIQLSQAVVMATDNQKRIVFAIPRHEMVIIGTTDTDFKNDPAEVRTLREDVEYLLKVTQEYFPGANIKEEDIVSCYAGVRPLVDDGSETESKTSREHLILQDEHNITFIAGGKYTTYRLMAEQCVETALTQFSIEDQVQFKLNNTKKALNTMATPQKLEEANQQIENWAHEFVYSELDIERMVSRHAYETYEILKEAHAKSYHNMYEAEALHAIQKSMCLHLKDFFTRRVPLHLADKNHGLDQLDQVARVFAKELNWTSEQIQIEKESFKEFLRQELDWRK